MLAIWLPRLITSSERGWFNLFLYVVKEFNHPTRHVYSPLTLLPFLLRFHNQQTNNAHQPNESMYRSIIDNFRYARYIVDLQNFYEHFSV